MTYAAGVYVLFISLDAQDVGVAASGMKPVLSNEVGNISFLKESVISSVPILRAMVLLTAINHSFSYSSKS